MLSSHPATTHTYSIELAHLLFAAASEADVIAKLLCKQIDPQQSPVNIDGYKPVITLHIPGSLRKTSLSLGMG